MIRKSISFADRRGALQSATLFLPLDARPSFCAVLAHGFGQSDDSQAVDRLASGLLGIRGAVLALGAGEPDTGGSGGSSPEAAADRVADAAAYLVGLFEAPTVLVGHSHAGLAVLEAAGQVPSLRAIATIGVPCAMNPADPDVLPFETRADGSRVGLLIMHAPLDTTVSVDHAARIFSAARHPKSFVSLDGADHLLSNEADAEFAATILAAWVRRYLAPAGHGENAAHGAPGDTHESTGTHAHRAIVRIGADHYRTDVLTDGHVLTADEPIGLGGTDRGPNPYNLLLSGLGACTAITIRMYADRKKWPLDAVEVHLEHTKVAPGEAECPSEGPRKVDVIRREVTLIGDLDDTQRARLLEIADRCPVHRTLETPPCMITTERRPEASDSH